MIYCFLADGFEETEAIAPVDLLRRAGKKVATVAVGTVGKKNITGSHGITVVCDLHHSEVEPSDAVEAIILPGGMPGSKNLSESRCVNLFLDYCVAHGKLVCAICAAPSVPGGRGMLNGFHAVCYPGFEENLKGAIISDSPVVRDGIFLTARSAGCAINFGLAIVASLCGNAEAVRIKESILCP